MVSAGPIEELENRKPEYILGARPGQQHKGRDLMLGCSGRCQQMADHLRVKEVWVKGKRYIVCPNPGEAARDAADREAMAAVEHRRLLVVSSFSGPPHPSSTPFPPLRWPGDGGFLKKKKPSVAVAALGLLTVFLWVNFQYLFELSAIYWRKCMGIEPTRRLPQTAHRI